MSALGLEGELSNKALYIHEVRLCSAHLAAPDLRLSPPAVAMRRDVCDVLAAAANGGGTANQQ